MRHWLVFLLLGILLLAGCQGGEPELPTTVPATAATEAVTEPAAETTAAPTVPQTEETQPPIVLELTQEDQELLLKIGMAELGHEGCPVCIALVMRTVLNRVESDRFSSTIRGVLYAQDQFTPVMDGSFGRAEPNPVCYEALDMVLRGWDESQGALYYEFCEGPSWHSQNLTLLTQHCNTRFYR